MSLVLGTLNFDYNYVSEKFNQEKINELLDICLENGIYYLDTAIYYKNTESLLGNYPYLSKFKITSKANPWKNNDFSSNEYGGLSFNNIINQWNISSKNLKIDCIDTYYIHAWDYITDISETCKAFNQLYNENKIKNFGISNININQIQDILKCCELNNYNKPNIYQGMYNIYCRKIEEIFPILKENNIKFECYNPLAGGILTGKYYDNQSLNFNCRFLQNDIYKSIFWNENIIKYTKDLCPKISINWLYDKCDKIIIGVSSKKQLIDTINSFKQITQDENKIIEDFYNNTKEYQPNYCY